MRSFKLSKKTKVLAAAGVLTVATAGGAYAYWSTTGSGSGSASTAAGASNLAIVQTGTIAGLYPGGPAQDISGSVTNNADSSAYVGTVTASIASVTPAAGATGGCAPSDYSLGGAAVPVNADLAKGASQTFGGQTIQFNNKAASNQDGCKGATVTLAFASN